MVKCIPLVQDIGAWTHHFKEMAKGNRHGQLVIQGSGTKTRKYPVIKMVSPTTAAVERAKVLIHYGNKLRKMKKNKRTPLL